MPGSVMDQTSHEEYTVSRVQLLVSPLEFNLSNNISEMVQLSVCVCVLCCAGPKSEFSNFERANTIQA